MRDSTSLRPAPAQRLLIVTGDDFGHSAPVNGAILAAHRRGILTSASLLVNEAGFEEAVAMARGTPSLAVGLHLALSLSNSALPPREIPGLVDARSRFLDSPVQAGWRYYFRRSAALEIEEETRAQIEKFLSTGLRFDHLDGHHNLHLHPTVFPIVARACADYGIPAVRILRDPLRSSLRLNPRRILSMTALSITFGLLGRKARRALRDIPIRTADRVIGLLLDGRMDGPTLRALLSSLPEGVTEIYCHPTLGEPGSSGRREYEALVDLETSRTLETAGLRLASYAELPPAETPDATLVALKD
jgi:hopanoid biosynthesis associated protein HpnK